MTDVQDYNDARKTKDQPPVTSDTIEMAKGMAETAASVKQRRKHYREEFLSMIEAQTAERPQLWKHFTSFGAELTTRDQLESIRESYPKTHEFFSEPHKVMCKEGKQVMSLRGRDYYFFHREFRGGVSNKTIETYTRLIGEFDRVNDILNSEYNNIDIQSMPFEERLFLLALLDYRKNILLNLLNTLVFLRGSTFEVLVEDTENTTKSLHSFKREKKGWENSVQPVLDTISKDSIDTIIDMAQECADDYYSALLGKDQRTHTFEPEQLDEHSEFMRQVLTGLRDTVGKHNKKHERIALKKLIRGERESDHPLLILLQAYLQNRNDERKGIQQDYVVPILYGGLELAFAYKSVGRLVNGRDTSSTQITPLVLSQYNVRNFAASTALGRYLPEDEVKAIAGKNVLVLDDNVISGRTVDTAIKIMIQEGATVHGSVTEVDMDGIADSYLPMSLIEILYPSIARVLPVDHKTRTRQQDQGGNRVVAIHHKQQLYILLKQQPE